MMQKVISTNLATEHQACLEREAIFLFKNVFHQAPDRNVLDKYVHWHRHFHRDLPSLEPIIDRSLDVEALLATRHPRLWSLRLKVQALIHITECQPQYAGFLSAREKGEATLRVASKWVAYGGRYVFKAAKGMYLLHKHSLI